MFEVKFHFGQTVSVENYQMIGPWDKFRMFGITYKEYFFGFVQRTKVPFKRYDWGTIAKIRSKT